MRLNTLALILLALLLPQYADACTKSTPGSCVSQDDGVPKATPTLGDAATTGSVTLWRGAQTVLVQPSATAGNVTATLPATTGTLVNTAGGQTIAGTLAVTGALTTAASQTFITPLLTGYDVNVLPLGANPASSGTGTTDNSTVINTALGMTTPGTSQTVNAYLPAGVYHVAHAITLGANQCLKGAGRGNTFIDVDMDFDPAATGVVIAATSGNLISEPCVEDLTFVTHLPPDITATASAATAGASSFTVSGATGTITSNMYVWDATTQAAIPIGNNQLPTYTTSVVSSTINISPVLAANIVNGDTIHFSQMRAGFAALGTCNTATAGGAPCQYPWMIYNNGARNMRINNVLVSNGWNGIYNRGSTFHFGYVQVSAFNIGLDIDDSLNFPQVQSYEFWNFGIASSNMPSPTALTNVFYDGSTVAANIGRTDGVAWNNLQAWTGQVNFTSNYTFGAFGNLLVDGNFGNLAVNACSGPGIQIANFYTTKNTFTTGNAITFNPNPANACRATISNAFLNVGSETVSSIVVSNGDLAINGGFISRSTTVTGSPAPVISQSAGFLSLNGLRLGASATLGSNITFLSQSGGKLEFTNNTFENTPGAGSIALALTDNAFNHVADNVFNGWLFTSPGPLGDYEPQYQAIYTSPGTYTYAPKIGYSKLRVKGCGWGGPGGAGAVTSTTAAASGGGGGGSGLCNDRIFPAPTGTITVVIGAAPVAGTAVTAGTPTAGTNGTQGGDSTVTWSGITSTLHFYPGGAGAGGQLAATSGGGGAAGIAGAGSSATGATGGGGGTGGGSAGGTGVAGSSAVTFGCGGAGSGATGVAANGGFNANYEAPGCGGSGGGLTASNGANNGGTGGREFGGGTLPAGGSGSGVVGGSATSGANDMAGGGAAGGYGAASGTTASTGGAGSVGDGGGGGGSCAYSSTCTSGAGGQGGAAFVELMWLR